MSNLRLIGLCSVLSVLAACHPLQRPADPLGFVYDFESDAELDRISWDCGQLYARDSSFVTSGHWGLRVRFLQGENLGLKFNGLFADWSGFDALVFDVRNPQSRPVPLLLHLGLYRDGEFVLVSLPVPVAAGDHHKRIPLHSLRYPGDGAPADLSLVLSARLVIPEPVRGTQLFFDDIHLE